MASLSFVLFLFWPLSVDVWIHDHLLVVSRLYANADGLTMVFQAVEWISLKKTLNQYMKTLSSYLQKCRLKLCKTRAVSTAFSLSGRETKRDLGIMGEGNSLTCNPTPTYPGFTLRGTIASRCRLETLQKRLASQVALIRQLTAESWEARKNALRSVALAVVHSAVWRCAPVCCCSDHTHMLDRPINDALSIVTGCLKPASNEYFPVLFSIPPASLRHKTVIPVLSLCPIGVWIQIVHFVDIITNCQPVCILGWEIDLSLSTGSAGLCQLVAITAGLLLFGRAIFVLALGDLKPWCSNGYCQRLQLVNVMRSGKFRIVSCVVARRSGLLLLPGIDCSMYVGISSTAVLETNSASYERRKNYLVISVCGK